MHVDSEYAKIHVTRAVANAPFTRAALFFEDGSHLLFEHSSRQRRCAQASGEGTLADTICLSLAQFRLNAKHLELFFGDGSRAQFRPAPWDTSGEL